MNTQKRATSLIPVRIGALLVSSGMLRPQSMQQALLNSRHTGKKIGQVLVSENLVEAHLLECALEIQQLIKQGEITVEMGTRALKDSQKSKRPVQATLSDLGFNEQKNIGNQDLAQVLLEAGCINQAQLDQARLNASNNGLPLGGNLVLSGAISPSVLGCALTVLILVRDKQVSLHAAVSALQTAIESRCSIEETLNLPSVVCPQHVQLGELLCQSGLLSESDAMIAAEHALFNHRSIGQVLLEFNMVLPMVLESALKLQAMIDKGTVTKAQAAALLQQVAEKQVGLETFLTEMSFLKSRVLELLLASRIVNRGLLEQALSLAPEQETDLLRALFSCKLLSQESFRAAVRCVYAIDDGLYTKEEATAWLHVTFVEATEPADAMLSA